MGKFESRSITLKNREVVEISPLQLEDYPLFEVYRHHLATETTHTLQAPEVPLDKDKITSKWGKMLSGGTDFLFKVTDAQGQMVGTCGLHFHRQDHPWIKHRAMFGMGVLKSHWGTGLAVEMMKLIEDIARSEGCRRLEAEVRVENERGVGLYKKMGFEIEGTRRRGALINGEFKDEYYIAKLL